MNKNICTLSIGIQKYRDDDLNRNKDRLRYSADDASSVSDYFKTVWPVDSRHLLLLDEDASIDSIVKTCNLISQLKPKLFLIFLSGHGNYNNKDNTWFCAYDATLSASSIDGFTLNKILSEVDAESTILLLDCCYAEAILVSCDFFRQLSGSQLRYFIASSRADQRSWEDDILKQGIFTKFLLKALSHPSPLENSGDEVAIDSKLFSYISSHVCLQVRNTKQSVQEPVFGGMQVVDLKLPIHHKKTYAPTHSIIETIKKERRRIITVLTAASLIGFLFVQIAFYHFAITYDGTIELRYGFRAVSFASLGIDLPRIQTGLSEKDIERGMLNKFDNGEIWGFWTQRDEAGLRRWNSTLIQYLSPIAKTEVALRMGKSPDTEVLKLLNNEDEFRALNAVANHLYVKGHTDNKAILTAIYQFLPGNLQTGCNYNHDIDYTVENLSSSAAAETFKLLTKLSANSVEDQKLALNRSINLIVGRIQSRSTNIDIDREFNSYLEFIRTISFVSDKDKNELINLAKIGDQDHLECRLAKLSVVAEIGDDHKIRDAQHELMDIFSSYDKNKSGYFLPKPQRIALYALDQSASKRPLSPVDVSRIVGPLISDENGLSGYTDFANWLKNMAVRQELPSDVRQFLFDEIFKNSDEYRQLLAIGIVARQSAAGFISLEPVKKELWMTLQANVGTTAGRDAIGWMACSSTPPIDITSTLLKQLPKKGTHPEPGKTSMGTSIISPFNQGVAVALSKILWKNPQYNDSIKPKLKKYAERSSTKLNATTYQALSVDRPPLDESTTSNNYIKRLSALSDSYPVRRLETEIFIQEIIRAEPSLRRKLLEQLTEKQKLQVEPEISLAIGETILRVREERLQPATPCSI